MKMWAHADDDVIPIEPFEGPWNLMKWSFAHSQHWKITDDPPFWVNLRNRVRAHALCPEVSVFIEKKVIDSGEGFRRVGAFEGYSRFTWCFAHRKEPVMNTHRDDGLS